MIREGRWRINPYFGLMEGIDQSAILVENDKMDVTKFSVLLSIDEMAFLCNAANQYNLARHLGSMSLVDYVRSLEKQLGIEPSRSPLSEGAVIRNANPLKMAWKEDRLPLKVIDHGEIKESV